MHVVAGAVIYFGCLVGAGMAKNQDVFPWLNAKTCLLAPLTAGIGKEVYDSRYGETAEFSDITATMFIPVTGYIIYEW